jgi:hypothetical protein
MSQSPEEFNAYRSKMNERILGQNNKVINRFFNLDTNTYAEGSLPSKNQRNAWFSGKYGIAL